MRQAHGNESVNLSTTECEKDLGVHVDPLLKFDEQVESATKKGRQMSGMIVRNITFKCSEIMTPLYISFVRPHLEYGNAVWHPYKRKNINKLEKVQRHFNKKISGLAGLDYTQRLSKLGLPSLEFRQIRGDF